MHLNIDLTNIKSVIAPAFHWLLTDKHRYQILVGGAGSSKSWSVAMTILFKILRDFNKPYKHRVLVLRRTSPAARRSVFELFKTIISDWGLESICSVNKTNMSIEFINSSKILVGGLDDESKLKSIEGLTSIWLEEASEHSRSTFLQCDLRLRGKTKLPYIIYITFNPISKNIFLYKDFFGQKNINAIIHRSTYKDNPWLDEIYKKHLESLIKKDYQYWRVYACGEFGELENLIFSNWDIIDNIPAKYTNSDAVFGADWGYVHKSSIVRIIEDGDDLFVKEEYYKDKQTHLQTIEWIQKYLPDNALIYGDSSEPGRLEEARRFGINIRPAVKGPNSIKDSIDFLKRYKIYITKDSTGLIQEMESYKWRQLRDGTVEEKPIDFNDDAIAALRYGTYSHFNKKVEYKIYTGE